MIVFSLPPSGQVVAVVGDYGRPACYVWFRTDGETNGSGADERKYSHQRPFESDTPSDVLGSNQLREPP